MTEKKLVAVIVPPDQFRTDQGASALWDLMGGIVLGAREQLGSDMAFSVILSRVTREMRREVGLAGAKQCLEGLIASMEQAAEGDR